MIHSHEHHHNEGDCCSNSSHKNENHSHGHSHDHDHDHSHGGDWKPILIAFILLVLGIVAEYTNLFPVFKSNIWIRLVWYVLAYLLVGVGVIKESWESILRKDFFNEFTLMLTATIGAFCIGEFSEAVGVMLFYSVGEMFQEMAVNKARNNIKSLLDIRPQEVVVVKDGLSSIKKPEDVEIGEIMQIKAGEKIALDGVLESENASLNSAALTGESRPLSLENGENVLAGMINIEKVILVKTIRKYEDSALAKILEMVQTASSHKAKTELFIRKFARIYTPLVFFFALAITFIPFLFVSNYEFTNWLYRGLVFLVISCPCALVISVPLGYFGGIGAASREGILFKGADFLENMEKLQQIVMDKTGTITKGVFSVQKVESTINENDFLDILSALEKHSSHPVAKAIVQFHASSLLVDEVIEVAGKGISGKIHNEEIFAGKPAYILSLGIKLPDDLMQIPETTIVLAKENDYLGHVIIADEIKPDSQEAIQSLKVLGINKLVVLSGDKHEIVQRVCAGLDIQQYYGDLLPEDKLNKLKELKKNGEITAFVGDGLNDAPALALADIGIAMGGLGSDVAIETADVVIQTDQLSKISTAIAISKETRKIVWQNIVLAIGVKVLVLFFGALGVANMWEAVFADVGVALLAILNAVRIQRKQF